MMGNTSILMFPIYGMAAIIHPLYKCIKNMNIIFRGIFYTIGIFIIEYTSGYMLKKRGKCPWDYSDSKHNISGLIRIDYAPAWFVVGLFLKNFLIPLIVEVMLTNSISTIVIAVIASTTTTALGTITGSCLPLILMLISW